MDIEESISLSEDDYDDGSFDGKTALFGESFPEDDSDGGDEIQPGETMELAGFDDHDQDQEKEEPAPRGDPLTATGIKELIEAQNNRDRQIQEFMQSQAVQNASHMKMLSEQMTKAFQSYQQPQRQDDEKPSGPPEIPQELWAENPTEAAMKLQEYYTNLNERKIQDKIEEQRRSFLEEQSKKEMERESLAKKQQWAQFAQSQVPEVAQKGSAVNKKFLAIAQSYHGEMLPYLMACTAAYNEMRERKKADIVAPAVAPVPSAESKRVSRYSKAQMSQSKTPANEMKRQKKMTAADKAFVKNFGLGEEGIKQFKRIKGIV